MRKFYTKLPDDVQYRLFIYKISKIKKLREKLREEKNRIKRQNRLGYFVLAIDFIF